MLAFPFNGIHRFIYGGVHEKICRLEHCFSRPVRFLIHGAGRSREEKGSRQVRELAEGRNQATHHVGGRIRVQKAENRRGKGQVHRPVLGQARSVAPRQGERVQGRMVRPLGIRQQDVFEGLDRQGVAHGHGPGLHDVRPSGPDPRRRIGPSETGIGRRLPDHGTPGNLGVSAHARPRIEQRVRGHFPEPAVRLRPGRNDAPTHPPCLGHLFQSRHFQSRPQRASHVQVFPG